MSSPRLRRLRLDHERLEARFRDWPSIRISAVVGDPPEQYQVTFNIRGLYATPMGQILERAQHVVEINLTLGYPRRAPQCKILTPIFHPNFDETSVCIGDFWAASEGLDDLIVRIGRMIAYQEYNSKSPLNGLAAKWAAQNAHLLPVESAEIAPPSEHVDVGDVEKLVVQFNGEFSPPEAAPVAPVTEYLPEPVISQPSPEETGPAQPGIPRLDFGTIAVALRPGLTTVGRSPDNSIQLSHTSISNRHAQLRETNAGTILRDLASTNGTTLNGLSITEALLTTGDRVAFGEIEAVFLVD